MKLALETPTSLLEMVQPFADFAWVLAHKVLEDEAYTKYYKEYDGVKYVDNSVNENGVPLDFDKIKQAFDLVGGTYLVSPDWIGDYKKTLEAYRDVISKFKPEKVLPVVQGETFEEAFECLNIIIGIMESKQIPLRVSVPYDICSQKTDPPWLMGLRRALFVSKIPGSIGVHLLGFDYIDEFIFYKDMPHVSSIDTGVPVWLGLEEKDILEPLEDKKKPTLNRMEDIQLSQKSWTAVCRNIALLRKYIG